MSILCVYNTQYGLDAGSNICYYAAMRMNGLLRMMTTGMLSWTLAAAQDAEMPDAATGEEAPALQQEEPSAAQQREAQQALKEAQEPDEHVVSQSRMFSVSGGDSLRMGAIATKADELKGHVNKLLGMESDWKYGISIRLLGQSSDAPRPNPIRTRISIIGHEPNLQIRIYPGGGIDVDKLSNAIITMLLYEQALRDVRVDALPESINLPMWLVTGIQQAVLWKTGRADRRLYRNLFERAEMLSPEEIVSTENAWDLDATTRQVYEVSCGVLMMSLINRPGGLVQLRDLVADAIMAEGSPKEIIASHFYELGVDANMLNKWWALELAALSLPRATEALTPMETEEHLNEALTIMYYDEESATPRPVNADDVYALTATPDWRKQMRPCVERLMDLSHRCFPGYRPIITEYCRAIGELLNGATPDAVQNILLPLRELRAAYVTTSIRGRDYLDWYEITHLGQANKAGFQHYLDAMRILRRESPGPDTHISRYLDDIEALHTIKAGDSVKDVLNGAKKKGKKAP
ncbi:MAG: hypothetical protein IJ985_02235 [Akkermansia sp.]|nr:hypothetical protein [Akkermansia sp.]